MTSTRPHAVLPDIESTPEREKGKSCREKKMYGNKYANSDVPARKERVPVDVMSSPIWPPNDLKPSNATLGVG